MDEAHRPPWVTAVIDVVGFARDLRSALQVLREPVDSCSRSRTRFGSPVGVHVARSSR